MKWQNRNVFPLLIIDASGGFQGLFVYSPSVGTGKLIASVAAAAGTDPYGNPYKAGITSYTAAGASVNVHDNQIDLAATVGGPVATVGQGGGGSLLESSGNSGLAGDTAMGLFMQSAKLTIAGTQPQLCLAPATPVPATPRMLEVQGDAIVSQLTAWHPNSIGSTEETWQSMASRGYQNSWTDQGAPNVLGQYRLNALNRIEVTGALIVPVAAPNTVIINLPSGYHPTSTQRLPMIIAGQSGGSPQLANPYASVDSNGNVTGHNFPAGLTTMNVEFAAGASFSRDA